ncbi:tetratricopeptide repeat protein [Rubrolithibacter danxiaensis]|uniref:tetratricopeptide repeat protein n=1 Tax=Rubrolithibacter danxiaensis TaxID=3390805 RepID=UPI003BF7D805
MRILLLNLIFAFATCSCIAQTVSTAELAHEYYQKGDYQKALPLYQQLFSQKADLSYYDPYFDSLLQLKNYSEAEKLVKKLIKLYPGNSLFKIDYGRILQEQGQQEKARELYNELIKNLQPNDFDIRSLATTFYRAGAYDFSIKTLQAGRQLLNNEAAFTYDLIALYKYLKNKDLLINEYLNALTLNPQTLPSIQNGLENALDKREDYDLFKKILFNRIQKEPQNISYIELLSWLYLQQNEFDLALKQVISLDKRLKEGGERIFELCATLISEKAYAVATEGLNYLINKGRESQYYIPSRIQLLTIKNQMLLQGIYDTESLQQLEKDYLSVLAELGKTVQTTFAVRQLAHLQAFYLNKPRQAKLLLEELLKNTALPVNTTGQIKLELGDIYILTDEPWEATLIYGQVEKQFPNEPMGQEAKFRNARLSYYTGDFGWAKAQLDVLKSVTSQLIANDALNLSLVIAENTASETDTLALKSYAHAELLTFKNQLPEAVSALDSISKKNPGTSLADDILMLKAKIFLRQKDFTKAITQLELIVSNYSFDLWADDAVFMLAELSENPLKSPEKASTYYQRLITQYPNSLFINEARKRYRHLRGDNLN